MTKAVVAFLLGLLALASIGTAVGQTEVRDGVVITRSVDAFTDETYAQFTVNTKDNPATSPASVTRPFLKVECSEGAVDGLLFAFWVIFSIDGGRMGEFMYRVDSGPVRELLAWQNETHVILFRDAGSELDSTPEVREILSGSTVVVRATDDEGHSGQAEYAIAPLRQALDQTGCEY